MNAAIHARDINAIVVDRDTFVSEAVESIMRYRLSSKNKFELGRELGREVRARFDIRRLLHHYDQFQTQL